MRIGWGGTAILVGLSLVVVACGSSAKPMTGRATALSPSCIPPAFKLFGSRPSVKELSTPLGATVLSRFAVFRRSALPSDDLARLKPVDGSLGRELSKLYELSGYYPAYVRQLTRRPDGRRYFVVPAYGRSEAVPPAHCLPAGERRLLVDEQRRRLIEPVDCIVVVGGSENAPTLGCEPFAGIDEGGRVFRSDRLTREPTVELVPDGVASVRIAFRETHAIAVPVSENAFVFTPPPPAPRVAAELKRLWPETVVKHQSRAQVRRVLLQWDKAVGETDPMRVEWLNSAGGLVRAISARRAGRPSETSVGDLRAPLEG